MADTMQDIPVAIAALPENGKLILRADAQNADIRAAIAGVLTAPLPVEPLTSMAGDKATALWLGPDEWLLLCAEADRAGLQQALEANLADLHASVVDVSDAYSGFAVTGPKAAELLSKGCAIDLHPVAFAEGKVVRSLLAKADITLLRTAADFQLYVLRSFAAYTRLWLDDAAREYRG
ncbi:sarcosine oxidase subunit gamma [Oceanibaculum pacificum]|uniref:Sarcosine oxidase subunit gamma n=1 Tax=Oceanibaculum pacificum TaxID=580166 RepID=A0A154V8G7_9PROT|nr:sarcosine oxidase subunit gamma family protein [Oceanibaculum pacificum]KZC97636.1 hypothetical protein AUP43_15120 [Oceanibaculum pacificum]